jgi:cell division protein FtsB
MSDLSPEVMDAAKVGGGGLLASALTVLAGRIFGSQDKVLARLELLQAQIQGIQTQLAVLTATVERRETDLSRLDTKVNEHATQLARLEGIVSKIVEGGR